MNSPEALLSRLDEIGASLSKRPSALALLGLGSVGLERDRLDRYSDLDFFVVVREGAKGAYLSDLDWMREVHPVAWAFQNTRDGHKLLFEDGIFCEYAVFEPAEMADAHHPGGRLVWHRKDFDPQLCVPRHLPVPPPPSDIEWIVGEAITNLYVGMSRYVRGEKWSALRFVQDFAVQRVADLLVRAGDGTEAGRDPYGIDRRFESRHASAALLFPRMMTGYYGTPDSARAILEFIEERHPVHPKMKAEILKLCALADEATD